MKSSIKYALVHLSVPSLVVVWLMFAGALAEGSLPLMVSLLGCFAATVALWNAWNELMHLEQQRQTRRQRLVVQHAQREPEKPQLRVA